MSGTDYPGHGPADPHGYVIYETGDGYVWKRLADEHASEPYPTREEAVEAAEEDAGA